MEIQNQGHNIEKGNIRKSLEKKTIIKKDRNIKKILSQKK